MAPQAVEAPGAGPRWGKYMRLMDYQGAFQEEHYDQMVDVTQCKAGMYPTLPQSRLRYNEAEGRASLMGKVKQKAVCWKRWVHGVHQLFLVIDDRHGKRDRQGAGAFLRNTKRRNNPEKEFKADAIMAARAGETLQLS